ncbi:MAG: lipocalin family protein [Bacteroidales bacterium]|nr:lipocalin family protein [Bacteroidales bacterium]
MKHLPLLITFIILTSCSSSMKKLTTVPDVDIQSYTGKWYEIARLPNSFEKGLICVTAEYSLRDDGKITVINAGHKESDPAAAKSIRGKAWVPDKNEPGRLKVQFFWPFAAGYYIFHLDRENYQYALVGNPSRKFLWILAREPQMEEALYQELVDVAQENGFAVEKLLWVKQDCWE